jgi:small subunit ribosomal protein S9
MSTETTITTTGRRKNAVARVRMTAGNGKVSINDRTLEEYFGRESSRMIFRQALELTETIGKYNVDVNVCGGGLSGQAEAIRHGLSRALCEATPEHRPALKKAGYLTRDARKKERKKPGQPGARKRFQYSKR